jgi:hypothetical protein
LEENNDYVSRLSFNSALNTVRAKLADSPVSLSFSAVERSRRPDGQGGCSISDVSTSISVSQARSALHCHQMWSTACHHGFADQKIEIEVEIKREITALYFPAPVGQNLTQQRSVENDHTKKN